MTVHSTSGIVGRDVEPTLTPLSAEEFAQRCQELCAHHSGHQLHLELDRLTTELLCSLGYGDGMRIFLTHAMPYHEEPMTTRYSYRRCVANLIFMTAVGWFALIGFIVSAMALVNAVKEWWS